MIILSLAALIVYSNSAQVDANVINTHSTDAAKTTTVFLVRHAEKAQLPNGDPNFRDPSLTDKGKARAELLGRMLKTAGVTRIYVSQYRRTMETASPLATQLGIKPVPISIEQRQDDPAKLTDKYLDQMANEVLSHIGENILIVGHDISVPAIIKALGGKESYVINPTIFDDLFILTLSSKENATVVRLKYGEPS